MPQHFRAVRSRYHDPPSPHNGCMAREGRDVCPLPLFIGISTPTTPAPTARLNSTQKMHIYFNPFSQSISQSPYNSPQAVMMTGLLGVPSGVPSASTALTTSIPLVTSPKTACLPSSHCVSTVVTKNCEP